MKQDRPRVSYKRDNIEWILNLLDQIPKYQLQQNNLRPYNGQHLLQCDQILKQNLYSYDNKLEKFVQMEFILYPNMLLNDQGYLILSTCTYVKKSIQYKEFVAQGIVLFNQQGQIFLFYESYVQQINWEKQLKRFCKLQNFDHKFTIKERLPIQGHYLCIKNKNNRPYTVQIIKFTSISDNAYEAIMNEINILMCFKQAGLPPFHALFQDLDVMFIVYEFWTGDSLFKVLQGGIKFNNLEIAQIIYQVVRVVKFIHQNQLYHGMITPNTVIVSKKQQEIKIYICGFHYREKVNWNWLIKKSPKCWLPPELWNAQKFSMQKLNPQALDVFQIGCLTYYLLFGKQNQCNSFAKQLDNFKIDLESLEQKASHSLCDFLKQMLDQDSFSRINLINALNHQWFVNVKVKSQIEKPKILQSLRTILELREQSSVDMSSRLAKEEILHVTSSSEEEEETNDIDNLHRLCKENNCIPFFLRYLNKDLLCPSRARIQI